MKTDHLNQHISLITLYLFPFFDVVGGKFFVSFYDCLFLIILLNDVISLIVYTPSLALTRAVGAPVAAVPAA